MSDNPFGVYAPLLDQVAQGTLTLEQACKRTASPSFASDVAPDELMRQARNARKNSTKFPDAMLRLSELVWSTFSANRNAFPDLGAALSIEFTHLAAVRLARAPQASLYRRTLARGEAEWHAARDPDIRGELAYCLGCLHLDPYFASKESTVDLIEWWHRAADPQSGKPDNTHGMPELDEAARLAGEWLCRALLDTRGTPRVETLKALVQLELMKGIFSLRSDTVKAREWYLEATNLAKDLQVQPETRSFLDRIAHLLDVPTGDRPPTVADTKDWDAMADQDGPSVLTEKLFAQLRLLSSKDPHEGIEMAMRAAPAVEQHLPEEGRITFYGIVQHIVTGVAADGDQLDQALESLASPDRRIQLEAFRSVFATAALRVNQDNAAEALKLLARVETEATKLWNGLRRAMLWITSEVNTEFGKAAWAKKDYGLSALAFVYSCLNLDSINLPQSAEVALQRVVQAAEGVANVRHLQRLCDLLRASTLPLRAGSDPQLHQRLSILAARTAALAQAGQSPEALFSAFRTVKGAAFGEALLGDGIPKQSWGNSFAPLMKAWIKAERVAGPAAPPPLFEVILSAYDQGPLPDPAQSASHHRDYLACRLDEFVTWAAARARSDATTASLAEVQVQLESDAVLVEFYSFRGATAAVTHWLMVTRDEAVCGTVDTGSMVNIALGDRVLGADGVEVLSLRKRVADEDEAQTSPVSLEASLRACIGFGIELLNTLKAGGKRRLYLAPYGAWHFAPLHLLGREGRGLAEDWQVVQLPSVELLRRPPPEARDEANSAIFGVTYAGGSTGRDGLGELKSVKEEVTAIARSLGVEPLLDGNVTRRSVMLGMEVCRRVHIACHGEHHVLAPWLQCLHLTPDEDDGRLFAADLLGLDLGRLELLSLSACETSLGRVDHADNLRGFAAAALSAGARCVIGTLWKTSDTAAREFFSHLYARLAEGSSVPDAYQAAQLHCRSLHPAMSDWGAFALYGKGVRSPHAT